MSSISVHTSEYQTKFFTHTNQFMQSKLETQYKYYLACTSPIAISVAADFMERATLVRYCLNSVAQD